MKTLDIKHNILYVNSRFIFRDLKESRIRLGLTQVELAKRSRISLPMLQLIESGRANPSLRLVEKLSRVLGFEIDFKFKTRASEVLPVFFGILTSYNQRSMIERMNREGLIKWVKLLVTELENKSMMLDVRVKDASHAILLSICEYYPKFAAQNSIHRPSTITGKVIKLKRLALPRLMEVMSR